MTNKSISCDTNEISIRVNSFYQTHESILFYLPYLFDHVSNIQDQFLHAMESDTMAPRAMEGDVHLPEDKTKCKLQVHTDVLLSGRPEDIRVWNDVCIYICIYILL